MLRLTQLLAIALIALSTTACHTVQHFVETGNYDGAIDYAVHKLQGKKNKKTEYVQGLELAFQKAQDRDLRLIDNLVAGGRDDNWEKVNTLDRRIRDRQAKISPLLPLKSKDGYAAHFIFVNIDKMEQESLEKAADYLYGQAEDLLRRATNGDRQAARDAYDKLTDLENRYFKNYRGSYDLKNQALQLGTTHILFETANRSSQVLPRDFFEHIMAIGTNDLNSKWQQFHFRNEPGIDIDYRVRFNVRQVDVSPERIQERAYTDCKEIENGFDYVLDARGNVKKDSLGNDIKTPHIDNITADVLEVLQTKSVRLSGLLEVYDANNNTRLDSQDLGSEIVFENYASTFKGDARALSDMTRQRLGNRPLPFPSTEDMLMQAADKLKPGLRDALRRNRAIL